MGEYHLDEGVPAGIPLFHSRIKVIVRDIVKKRNRETQR